MTHKTIFYSVSNGGDGSAYPHFFEDAECAEIHQNLQEEGWGESCTGSLSMFCDSDANIIVERAQTKQEYITELQEALKWELEYRPDCLQEAPEFIVDPQWPTWQTDMAKNRHEEKYDTRGKRIKKALEKLGSL